ncbi:MAG: peptidase domain-containing ABC transporter [Candidatus Cloacimonetes bacterium]|nr:peptidase domain-containing ABC transporter [Candidatus Cloacimonadota bacterium]
MNELSLEYLSHQEFFQNLTHDQLQRVSSVISIREYRLGQHIIHNGDLVKSMLVIVSGSIEQRSAQSLHHDKTLKTLSNKDQYGVESLTNICVSKYDLIVASSEVVLLEIDPLALIEFCLSSKNTDISQSFDDYRSQKLYPSVHFQASQLLSEGQLCTDIPKHHSLLLLSGRLIINQCDKAITLNRGESFKLPALDEEPSILAQQNSKFRFFTDNSNTPYSEPAIPVEVAPQSKRLNLQKTVNVRKKSNFTHYFQSNSNDCGDACLLMICDYYHSYPTRLFLSSLLNKNDAGSSLENLQSCAQSLGFICESMYLTIVDLKTITAPCIINYKSNHWIVVYGYKNQRFLVADPALGKLSINEKDFAEHFNGYTLTLAPGQSFPNFNNRLPTSTHYLEYLKPYFWQIILITLASITIQTLSLSVPLFAKFVVDVTIIEQNLDWLDTIFAVVIALVVSQFYLEFIRFKLISHFGLRVKLHIMKDFFTQVLSLPIQFFNSHKAGDILTRFQESDRISKFLTQDGLQIILDATTTILYLGVMFYFSWELSSLITLMIVLNIVFLRILSPKMNAVNTEIFQKSSSVQSFTVEILNGFKTIKLLNLQNAIRWKWENLQVKFYNSYLKGLSYSTFVSSIANFMHHFLNLLIVLIGFQFVILRQLSIGDLLAFSIMSACLNKSILSLVENWDELEFTKSAMERVQDIFESPSETIASSERIDVQKFRGNIQIENLSFRYESAPNINVLQNFNLKIDGGQNIAIVGRSGSGKSTLFSLMSVLYPLNTGTIHYDGFEVSDLNLRNLRQQIVQVSQDSFVFKGTIRDCITKNSVLVPMEEIIKVAKLSCCHAFIADLPKGYDTYIDSSASNLSRGQKQRLMLANLFLQSPSIIILDEIFSAIDADTEKTIVNNIFSHFTEQTILLATHKLDISKQFDQILVLDSGHVREFGHYQTLLDNKDLYYHLMNHSIDTET